MNRTKLKDRILPSYTRGEEIFNSISHIVGGGLSVLSCALCVVFSALKHDALLTVSCAIYGASLIALYCMSSIYHGLYPSTGKKVMQVIDHCTIYFLIFGTYMPISLCAVGKISPVRGIVILSLVGALCAVACTLTAIDLKKYSAFSMICYILTGWCVVFALKMTVEALTVTGFAYLLAGGISYTVGAVIYKIGKTKKYMHSVFHIFVVIGSVFQFVSVFFFVVLA